MMQALPEPFPPWAPKKMTVGIHPMPTHHSHELRMALIPWKMMSLGMVLIGKIPENWSNTEPRLWGKGMKDIRPTNHATNAWRMALD